MTKEEIIQYIEILRGKLSQSDFWVEGNERKYLDQSGCLRLFDHILEDIKQDN